MVKIIKKVLIAASAVILLFIFTTACSSNEKCAAYGESYKYQKEQGY